MTIQKQCADHPRVHHTAATGGRLSSGQAHELVAAFFGHLTAAALQAERKYLVDYLPQADVLIPDLAHLNERRLGIAGLPADFSDADGIANVLEESFRRPVTSRAMSGTRGIFRRISTRTSCSPTR